MAKLKKRPDGLYVKTITDPFTKKRIFFYGKTQTEINQKIFDYSKKIERGRTWKEVSDEWWEEAEKGLAIQSVHTYRKGKERADGFFRDILISQIKSKDILDFYNVLVRQGFAKKTIYNTRLVTNLIFSYAVLNREIEYNPCAYVKLPKNLKTAKRISASSQDEEKIIQAKDEWLFPLFALCTGMRKGEILALKWEDIDFDNDIISVTKSVCYDGNRPVVKQPKTEAGIRTVPLLRALKSNLLDKNIKSGYIFHDEKGDLLSKSYFMKLYDQYQKKGRYLLHTSPIASFFCYDCL